MKTLPPFKDNQKLKLIYKLMQLLMDYQVPFKDLQEMMKYKKYPTYQDLLKKTRCFKLRHSKNFLDWALYRFEAQKKEGYLTLNGDENFKGSTHCTDYFHYFSTN